MELFRSICKIQTCKQIQQIREDSCINLTSNDTMTNTIPAFVGVLSHSKPLQTHVHPWESDVTLERERESVLVEREGSPINDERSPQTPAAEPQMQFEGGGLCLWDFVDRNQWFRFQKTLWFIAQKQKARENGARKPRNPNWLHLNVVAKLLLQRTNCADGFLYLGYI